MKDWEFWIAFLVGILWAAVSSYFGSKARLYRDINKGN